MWTNRYGSALRRRGVGRFLAGKALSAIGDSMDEVVVVLLAESVAADGSAGIAIGSSVAAYALPGFFVLWALSDRISHVASRTLIIGDSVIRASLFGGLAALAYFDVLTIPLLVGLLAVGGTTQAIGRSASAVAIRDLISDDEDLFAANSLLGVGIQVATLLGPVLAGVLVATSGPAIALTVDAATFLILAWAATVLPKDASTVATAQTTVEARGWSTMGSLPVWILSVTLVFFALYGPMVVVLPLKMNDLTSSPESSSYLLGVAWSMLGAGSLLGGAVGGGIRSLLAPTAMAAIVSLWGVATLTVGLSQGVSTLLAAMFFGGLVYAPYSAIVSSLMQARLGRGLYESTNAKYAAIASLGPPIGMLVGGGLVGLFSPDALLSITGAATIVAGGVAALLRPIEHARH